MKISNIVMERLALIKYIYHLAIEQSQRSEPLSSASILAYHDSIELFLQLASEFLDIGKKSVNFMDYWDLIALKIQGEGLTQKESLRRLNKSRVALKHHGTRPSKLDVEAFRASATSFFEENTPTVFGIEFSDISLVKLIQCEDAKQKLTEAEKKLKENKIEEALADVALAFVLLVDDYENRKRGRFGRSPFFFGGSMAFQSSFSIGIKGRLGGFIDKVKESVEALQESVKILSLGLDYRRYARFRLLTPNVGRTLGGYRISRAKSGSEGRLDAGDVEFCKNFVIESAIALQEFDFSLEKET